MADKQIEYTRLVTTCNDGAHYRPFWELTRCSAHIAIKNCSSRQIPRGLMPNFRRNRAADEPVPVLERLPENREVLQALQAQGVPTGILSNGDVAMLTLALKSSGLHRLVDHIISVDAVKKYKTHPAAYALGESTLGLPHQDSVCQQQRLGRAGRDLVWLPDAVGQPQPATL